MGEWSTYRLEDFLMFSPRTWWRLVALYNRELWPLQAVTLGAGVALVALASRQAARAHRPVVAVLALTWLWVGWAFHWERYAAVNWGARYLAAAFLLQAVLFLVAAAWYRSTVAGPGPTVQRLGLVLAVGGVLVYPVIGWPAGRPWDQAEVFGFMPEPTALATLGLLLATAPRRGWLIAIPLLSVAVGAATAWLLAG